MKSSIAALERLKASRSLLNPEEIQTFDTALNAISKNMNEDVVLRELHFILCDDTSHPEVMYGLVHLLETVSVERQVTALMDVLPIIAIQASDWVRIIVTRLLNEPEASLTLCKAVSATQNSHAQNLMKRIMQEIRSELNGIG